MNLIQENIIFLIVINRPHKDENNTQENCIHKKIAANWETLLSFPHKAKTNYTIQIFLSLNKKEEFDIANSLSNQPFQIRLIINSGTWVSPGSKVKQYKLI